LTGAPRGVPAAPRDCIGAQGGVRHPGPFAEDSRAEFRLDGGSRSIAVLKIDGANVAA
jgi:hypothetical protein